MSIESVEHSGWFELIINRPNKRNALNLAMWQQIATCLEELKQREDLHILVLRGVDGCFSAGADIKEFSENSQDKAWLDNNNRQIKATQAILSSFKIPTLAVIDGACVGGGCGLALACDYRLASSRSAFALTPVKLGLLYSLEDTQRLVSVVGIARAKQMLLLAETVAASQALQWGLIHEMVEPHQLEQRCEALRQTFCSYSSHALRGIKSTFNYLMGDSSHSIENLHKQFVAAFTSNAHQQAVEKFKK